MEIIAEKTKLMANSTNGINKEIKVSGEKLDTLTHFNTWEASSLTKDPNLRSCQKQTKQQRVGKTKTNMDSQQHPPQI